MTRTRSRSRDTLEKAVRFCGEVETARRSRDRELRAAYDSGWTYREIARATGLSTSGVHKIVTACRGQEVASA